MDRKIGWSTTFPHHMGEAAAEAARGRPACVHNGSFP